MFVTIVVVVSGGYGWDDRFTLAILAQACIVLPSHPPYYFTFVTFATLLLCCLVVLLALLHGLWQSSQLSTLLEYGSFPRCCVAAALQAAPSQGEKAVSQLGTLRRVRAWRPPSVASA